MTKTHSEALRAAIHAFNRENLFYAGVEAAIQTYNEARGQEAWAEYINGSLWRVHPERQKLMRTDAMRVLIISQQDFVATQPAPLKPFPDNEFEAKSTHQPAPPVATPQEEAEEAAAGALGIKPDREGRDDVRFVPEAGARHPDPEGEPDDGTALLEDMHGLHELSSDEKYRQDEVEIGEADTVATTPPTPREAVQSVVLEAFRLLDGTAFDDEDRNPQVSLEDWQRLGDAYEALNALVPDSEQPFDGGYAVTYLWPQKELTPNPFPDKDSGTESGSEELTPTISKTETVPQTPSAGEDIVGRLQIKNGSLSNVLQSAAKSLADQADEIERLRADIENRDTVAQSLARTRDARIKELEEALEQIEAEDQHDSGVYGDLEADYRPGHFAQIARSTLSNTQG